MRDYRSVEAQLKDANYQIEIIRLERDEYMQHNNALKKINKDLHERLKSIEAQHKVAKRDLEACRESERKLIEDGRHF